jgi:hypothetical protein
MREQIREPWEDIEEIDEQIEEMYEYTSTKVQQPPLLMYVKPLFFYTH